MIGAVGGPFAYYAGVKLGALQFTGFGPAITGIAIVWGIALPLLCWLAARVDRAEIFRTATVTALCGLFAERTRDTATASRGSRYQPRANGLSPCCSMGARSASTISG